MTTLQRSQLSGYSYLSPGKTCSDEHILYEHRSPNVPGGSYSPGKRLAKGNYTEVSPFSDAQQLALSLGSLEEEIEASKYLLELPDGWDGENGTKYDIRTWERATKFLRAMYQTAYRRFNVIPDTPDIFHGPSGSIDIWWDKPNYQILVNCPEDETKQVSFGGEEFNKGSFKGSFNITDSYPSLLMILIGIKICGS